jgi:CysZ protein
MPNHPTNGLRYFLTGFKLIQQPGIRPFVVIPLLINILLFGFLIVYGWFQFQALVNYGQAWLTGWTAGLPEWLASMLNWVTNWLWWILLPLFVTTVLMIILFAFSWLANVIAGPFNGLLAEAVERHLTGKAVESVDNTPWYVSIPAIIWDEIGKLLYYLVWAGIIFILSFVPVVNIISPILWFLFGAWLLSLELADAPLGNYGYRAREQRKIMASRRYLTFEFGSVALLFTMIPVVNFIVMPVGVAGVTCLWVKELQPVLNQQNIRS